MKKSIRTSIILSAFLLILSNCLFAQYPENYPQYISSGSGDWAVKETWRVKANASATPVDASNIPTSSSYVVIKTGHIVDIKAGVQILGLIIEPGAKLDNSTGAFSFSIGTTAVTQKTYVINDGVIASGGTTTRSIRMVVLSGVREFEISGSGETNLGRLYAKGGNTDLKFIIDTDVTLLEASAFSAMDVNTAGRTANDKVVLTIKPGKTVGAGASGIAFHSTALPTTSVGDYTYNIDGGLDFSQSTATSYVVGVSNEESKVTLNITGKVMLNKNFITKADETGAEETKVKINVSGEGEIDLNNNTTLTLGKTFFNLSDKARVVKKVGDNLAYNFPIGSNAIYSPINIKNTSGAEKEYKVGLKNSIDDTGIDLTKSVNKQWTILPETSGAFTARFSWLNTNEGALFNSASAVIGRKSSGESTWTESAATFSSDAIHQFAEADFTSGGVFLVGTAETLPLQFISFNAQRLSNYANRVVINWTTANEVNVSDFVIERAFNQVDFETIGAVKANSEKGINNYTYNDNTPAIGISYYRIRQNDFDNAFAYSKIIAVKYTSEKGFSVYPNPARSILNVNHSVTSGTAKCLIYSLDGKHLQTVLLSKGVNSSALNVENLAPGIYVLTYNNEGEKEALQFVKR